MVDMLICILCSSHYVIAKSKAFFVFAFKICLRHQLVMPFLSGVPPTKKNPRSAPAHVAIASADTN